jgi:4'-phosphopantetheinyl transferase
MLDGPERERAKRFRFRRDRDFFVARRGALRQLLGGLLEVPGERLRFSVGPRGKPLLPGAPLSFNLSRSGAFALFAVAGGSEVGVDLERIRAIPDRDRIAERFFSPRELEALGALPPHQRDEAFFLCWTRKEAYVKARGEGLSLPLDSFSVSLSAGDPDALLEGAPENSAWSLIDLSPGTSWAGAVAVRGRDWQLLRWMWEVGPRAR